MSLKSRLFIFDVEQFQARYRRSDSIYSYFRVLLDILHQEDVLVLDHTLIEKIYQVSMTLAFSYPKDQEIQELRKKVFQELHKQEMSLKEAEEERLEKVILKEREERNIPSCIPIEKEHVIEMYKQDFQNYVSIYFQPLSKEEINLFYYLTTVNRICYDLPEYVDEVKNVIRFTIIKLMNEVSQSAEVLEYAETTMQRLFGKEEERSSKIIDLSKRV